MIDLQNPEELAAHVAQLIDACEQYLDDQFAERSTAQEYVNGEMTDLQPDQNRSSVVSHDTRAAIKKLMPSILWNILGNDQLVAYSPMGPEDDETSEQATQYVNQLIVPESDAENAIYDAISDALQVKTGILKWAAEEVRIKKTNYFNNQMPDALIGLEGEEGIEIEDLETDEITGLLSFTVRRREDRVRIILSAIPRGQFLIAPGSKTIEDAPVCGERQEVTRSDLVSRGYDRDLVDELSVYDTRSNENDDDEKAREGDDYSDIKIDTAKAMETVLVHEMYVRLDMDDDGIAEIHRIVIGEGAGESDKTRHIILEMEEVDEAPYADVVAEREAHQFEGHSVVEDLIQIQRIKTTLKRQILDNLYAHNNPQPVIDESRLTDDGQDAVVNPEFGKPITVKPGTDVNTAVFWQEVTFVGDKALAIMEHFDRDAEDYTGATDQSAGVDADAFQKMSATAATLINEKGIAQSVMIIRSLARGGIKKAFKGLLRLTVAHGDPERAIRLRNQEWVRYDPRSWNAEMDAVVNIGLGAGTRERDLTVLQIIYGIQKEIIAEIGLDNPFVKPEQVYNTMAKIVEAAGFPSSEPFFSEPTPDEAEMLKQKDGQGEGQDPTKAMELQLKAQIEQEKANGRIAVENAQMQADLQVEQARLANEAALKTMEINHKAETDALRMELDLIKHREKLQLEHDKLDLQYDKLTIDQQNRIQPATVNGAGNGQ